MPNRVSFVCVQNARVLCVGSDGQNMGRWGVLGPAGFGCFTGVRSCRPPVFGGCGFFCAAGMCRDIVQPRAAAAYVAACTQRRLILCCGMLAHS
jgi:hypothetical protein